MVTERKAGFMQEWEGEENVGGEAAATGVGIGGHGEE